jgi:hypothetical protein
VGALAYSLGAANLRHIKIDRHGHQPRRRFSGVAKRSKSCQAGAQQTEGAVERHVNLNLAVIVAATILRLHRQSFYTVNAGCYRMHRIINQRIDILHIDVIAQLGLRQGHDDLERTVVPVQIGEVWPNARRDTGWCDP